MTRKTESGTPPDDVAMITGNGYCCGLDVKWPSKDYELKAWSPRMILGKGKFSDNGA